MRQQIVLRYLDSVRFNGRCEPVDRGRDHHPLFGRYRPGGDGTARWLGDTGAVQLLGGPDVREASPADIRWAVIRCARVEDAP